MTVPRAFLLSLAFLLAQPASMKADSVSFEDIIKGLADSEAALQNFSLTFRARSENQSPWQDKKRFEETVAGTATVDSTGRARYEAEKTSHQIGVPDAPNTSRYQAVFDGKSLREISGVKEADFRGRITSARYEMQWPIDPFEYATHYNNKPLSKLFIDLKAKITGQEVHNGREVVVVETTPAITDQHYKSRTLIDLALGFAAVRKSLWFRRGPDDQWQEYASITGSEYAEVSPGIWLPGRILEETHVANGPATDKNLLWRRTVDMEKWVVNAELPADTFELIFPPNLFVTDQVNGRLYQTMAVNDETVKNTVAEARRVRAAAARAWNIPGAALIDAINPRLFWIVVMSLTVAVVLISVKRYRALKSVILTTEP